MSGQDRPRVSTVLQLPTDASPNPHFLHVDDTMRRQRANSDPIVHTLPEILVTGEDGSDWATGEDSELDRFLMPPTPRKRANTCPDDLFNLKKDRPPTPPPSGIVKGRAGKRYSYNFTPRDLNGISFAHHKLSKVSEASHCGEEEEEEEGGATGVSAKYGSSTLQQAGPGQFRRHSAIPDNRPSHSSAFSMTRHGMSLGNAFQGLSMNDQQHIASQRPTTAPKTTEAMNNDGGKQSEVSSCSSHTRRTQDSGHETVDSARLQAC